MRTALSFSWLLGAIVFGGGAPAIAADELSSTSTLFVRDIQVDGNLVPRAVLDEVLPRYRNRELSADDLLKLAQQLTAYLVDLGYVNSGVILPDQKIVGGVVHLQAVAGRVDKVVVTGNRHLTDRYIATRVGTGKGAFNINATVERLQVLERDPRIERLNAELKPSTERGSALLNINVEESRVWGISAGADNHISPNVGGQQWLVDAYHLSLLGLGDALSAGYRRAEGYESESGQYSVPLNRFDTRITLLYEQSTSTVVVEPFAQLDIEGSTHREALLIKQPLIHSINTELSIELGIHREQVKSFLLGEPFSFSASEPDGVSNVTLAQFTQELVLRGTQSVFAVRSSFNFGIDALQATIGGEADGRFLEWSGQGEWIRKLDWRESVVGIKMQMHLANDSLPAYRKYSLGGASSVRGYRENLMTRDSGVFASIDWTVPVAHLRVPWLSDALADGQISIIPFVDYGYGWDYNPDRTDSVALASVGVGVQWRIGRNSNVELQYGKALIDHAPPQAQKDAQDIGVHFSVRLGF